MTASSRRSRPARAAIVLVIGSLALGTAGPAAAGWTKESITQSWFLSRPSLAVEPDDHLEVVYERHGTDPGLFFATDSSGSWADERITSGDHWGADVVLDASGDLHVAYASFGTDTGIHYLTNAGGSWTDTRVTTEVEVDQPSIALDGAGHIHIVYAVHGHDPGVYHLSDETGGWVRTRLVSAAHEYSPDLAIDPNGRLHVVSARFAPEAPGLYYLTRTAGVWSAVTRVTSAYDDWPSIAVDAAGKVHMAFQRFGSQPAEAYRGQLLTASNALGSWAFERMPSTFFEGFRIGPPDVALDGTGNLHVVARESSTDPAGGSLLVHYAGSLGSWTWADVPLVVSGADIDYPSVGIRSDGSFRAAYRSFGGETSGIFISGPNSAEIAATSRDDVDPSLDSTGDGTRHLTFDRAHATSSERGLHYGDESGGWSFERMQIGPSTSDVPPGPATLAMAPDGSARVLLTGPGVQHLTNENGTWESDTGFCCNGVGEFVLDAAGKSHVALTGPAGFTLQYATNVTGSWATTDVYQIQFSGDSVDDPAIAVDGSGRRTIFFAYRTPSFTPGLFVTSAANGSPWPGTATRLYSGVMTGIRAMSDGANKLHLVWVDRGAAAGVYYATNRTGTWVRTRLSRSEADGTPSIGVDADGAVFVAFSRGYWAASPGVYLATDRTGVWQVSRVSDDPYAADPSIDVGPDGLADIAYVNDVDGVSILAEDATTSAAPARTSTAARIALRGATAQGRPSGAGDAPTRGVGRQSTDTTLIDRHEAAR